MGLGERGGFVWGGAAFEFLGTLTRDEVVGNSEDLKMNKARTRIMGGAVASGRQATRGSFIPFSVPALPRFRGDEDKTSLPKLVE